MTCLDSFTGYFYPYSLFSNISSDLYHYQNTFCLLYNGTIDYHLSQSKHEILDMIRTKHVSSFDLKFGDVVILGDSVYTISTHGWISVSYFPERYWYASTDFVPNL